MHRLTGLLLLVFIAACSSPKPLVYRQLHSIRVQNLDLAQAVIVVELQFYNPNPYSMSLKNGELDAYINNKAVGQASIDERTLIPARDSFLLPVTVTARLSDIIGNALEIFGNKDKEVLVRLQGTLHAGKGGVYVRVPVHYQGTQRLNL